MLRPSGNPKTALTLADLADRKFLTVGGDTPLHEVMIRLSAADADVVLVTDGSGSLSSGSVPRLITKPQVANAVIKELVVFSD